ncbi:MAG: hypothetical protein AMXMBFR78_35800 [Rubrivivax sp.]|nr:hypothetical protein [Rubrivivax sp.]
MPRAPQHAWYRQGIVWLAAAVLAASLAGSGWLIHVAGRYVDPPLPAEELTGPRLPKLPPARPEAASATAGLEAAPR